jgi:hypothetical protein
VQLQVGGDGCHKLCWDTEENSGNLEKAIECCPVISRNDNVNVPDSPTANTVVPTRSV